MKFTHSALLDLLYRFYPRNVPHWHRDHVAPGDIIYDDTEEHLRLVQAAKRGKAEYPTWNAMLRRLKNRYIIQDNAICLLADTVIPSFTADVSVTADHCTVLRFHVSLLGPYYGIQSPGTPEADPIARDVLAEIEATYPGYQQIPPEIGNVIVPDVAMDGILMGDATIYICLFSEFWARPLRF